MIGSGSREEASSVATRFNLPFLLLADTEWLTCSRYGLNKLLSMWQCSTRVLVDKEGIICCCQSAINPYENVRAETLRETESGKYHTQVNQHISKAIARGITSVPAFTVQERYTIFGAQPYDVFQGLMIRLGKNLSLNASNIGGTFNGLASESLFVNFGRTTNKNINS